MHLFAKAKNVNVVLYEQVIEDIFEWRHEFEATSKDSAETIHLIRHKSRDDNSRVYYTLFVPKLYSIMKALQAVKDTATLQKIYVKISDAVQGRNGLVVDYNPLLTALLGCNTNLLFLGSKEQSRGALFYIGPYINKNGVEIIDALPLIAEAQNKALTYLSVAEDAGTDKRTVQHTLHKTLNKLNSKMEVSDTQAAGALLDLDARITDEIFSYYDVKGYKNFVLDTIVHDLHQNFEPRGNIEDLGECDTDDEAEFSADESCDGDESIEETVEDSDKGNEPPDDSWKAFEDDCCDKFDMRHDKGAYGHAKIYNMGKDDLTGSVESHAVSYPELYRYRGPDLKHLNRLEYCALVKVGINKEKDEDEDEATPGRKPNKKYQFGSGLKETIGSKYCQILRSKQCTPKFFCKLPPPPGKKPANPSKARRWKKKADTFAFHYLTMFRPEADFYDLSIDCKFDYKYDWEAFLEFESSLRCSDRAIDHSRLELMERYIHGWKVNTAKRMMLANYRGRNRTEWSKEQQQMAREYKTKAMENHSDVFDYDCQFKITELSSGQKKKNEKIDTHKRECVSILQDCASGALEYHHKAKSNRKLPRIPLNIDSYKSLKEAKPALDNKPTVQNCCPVPRLIARQVDKYLKKQDLSTDKDQAVQILRDHFTAMHEGRSEVDDYEAPYLLICGGPGNGKSKLVETFDGMSKCMDVGSLVKTAFVGGAAVNINGSSLLGLFDIPVIDKGDGTEETKKKRIIPWSSDKRRRFLDRYDLDRISCIIVDEISTVKPYMFAYLNARLMELYRDSGKPFGGRAVVLLGDFDQLPPVGGDSLSGAAMKYEEAVCKKEASSADDCEEDLTAFLSGHFDPKKCVDLKTAGVLLFQRVKHIKLTEQHRSKDPEHTALLQKMSSQGRLHPRHLKLYKDLSEEDMKDEDGEFAFATMVVTGNAERHELNALQAKRWASRHNTKVMRWFRKRDGKKWKGKPGNQNHEAMAMQEDCFYEMFVPGAAGYITQNINTDIGLANGVEIKYHSLSFESEEEDMIFYEEFEADGSLVMTLDRPPAAINIELFADFPGDSRDKKQENKRKRKKWTHGSLVDDGRVVVQLSRQWGSELIRKWKDESIAGSWRFGYNVSTLPMKDYFPIEPAFSVTIYKAQGRTIRRLIIFVSQHPIPLLRMSWEGLYVALSRVKYRDHIRLAIKRNDHGRHSLQYMENLRKNKYTASFFSGFKPIGASQVMTWNRKAAWKAAGFDKLAKDMSKVKKTPNKARKKRTMADIQNAMKRKKRRKT